jgi:hypothetical protein
MSLRRFRLLVTAVDLFSAVIIQTIPLKAAHAAKPALFTNYKLCSVHVCQCQRHLSFFALYDARIRAAQLVRNEALREIAGGKKIVITLLII